MVMCKIRLISIVILCAIVAALSQCLAELLQFGPLIKYTANRVNIIAFLFTLRVSADFYTSFSSFGELPHSCK